MTRQKGSSVFSSAPWADRTHRILRRATQIPFTSDPEGNRLKAQFAFKSPEGQRFKEVIQSLEEKVQLPAFKQCLENYLKHNKSFQIECTRRNDLAAIPEYRIELLNEKGHPIVTSQFMEKTLRSLPEERFGAFGESSTYEFTMSTADQILWTETLLAFLEEREEDLFSRK